MKPIIIWKILSEIAIAILLIVFYSCFMDIVEIVTGGFDTGLLFVVSSLSIGLYCCFRIFYHVEKHNKQ